MLHRTADLGLEGSRGRTALLGLLLLLWSSAFVRCSTGDSATPGSVTPGVPTNAGTAASAPNEGAGGSSAPCDCTGTTPNCLNGACVACAPNAVRCNGAAPQKCDTTGRWQSGATCTGSTPFCCRGGCSASSARPTFTIDDYPRVDGANATLPLDMVVACELLGVPWRWFDCSTQWSLCESSVEPDGPLASALRAKIVHNDTHTAYLKLVDGTADVIFEASLPTAAERSYAASRGVTLEANPVALDALVFLLDAKNPVSKLTKDQVLGIYDARLHHWNELGGLAHDIHPYWRPRSSGSFALFDALFLKGSTVPDWAPDYLVMTMSGLVNYVAEDPDAIGYSGFYYLRNMLPGLAAGTKLPRFDGVEATPETIGMRLYPLTTETYVVTRTNLAPASGAAKLRDWLLAPDGQSVVKKSGYVSLCGG